MKRLQYLLRCILKMNYLALFRAAAQAHRLGKHSRLFYFFDIVYCGLHYGAGYKDYLLCRFYDLTASQRATYVTRGINHSIMRKVDDASCYHILENKNEMYSYLAPYLGREYLYMPEASPAQFEKFISSKTRVLCKPSDQCCGRGIEIVNKADFISLQQMYRHFYSLGNVLLEEILVQHPVMASMFEGSVNTVRVGTIKCGQEKPQIMYAFLRIGNSGRPVDNLNAGGMCAPVDLTTGELTAPACDKELKVYRIHPVSGTAVEGFRIPYWAEAKAMCLEAAEKLPGMGYVGWDVCITEDGPVLIEANNNPGHDILQMPAHLPADKTGMLPRFKQVIPDL